MTSNCSSADCSLCLESDLNYCIVCKNDNYTIVYDDNYTFGKIKLCKNKEEEAKMSDVDSTNIDSQMTNNELTYMTYINETSYIDKESSISDVEDMNLTYMTYLIVTSYIDKENSISDVSYSENVLKLEDMINNNKYININLSNEEIEYIHEEIKKYLKDKYDGKNIIINTHNVKIQLSNIDTQKYSKDLSNIDLRECEEQLKTKYCKTENDSLKVMNLI